MAVNGNEDDYVCVDCFGDSGIRRYIEDNVTSTDCSFCGNHAEDPIAALLNDVADYINQCLYEEYDMAENWLGRMDQEWVGEYWDTWDLLDKIGLELPRHGSDRLLSALVHRLDDNAWCVHDPYGLSDTQIAQFSWRRFCRVIKHERRFFFSNHGAGVDPDQTLLPGEVLERIFEYAQQAGLVRTLDVGTILYRARYQHPDKDLRTAKELGPPPVELANQANRMSPAGIVMFYGSDSPETALRETAAAPGTFAVGKFLTHRRATVLDLAELPEIPSLFEEIPDSLEYNPRRVLRFLHHISEEISQPIMRDDRVHISYAPTQVVTEYIRTRVGEDGMQLDGIKYPSAVHDGHVSYVLFATQDDVSDAPLPAGHNSPWIQLIDRSIHSCKQEDIDAWRRETPVSFSDEEVPS